jgi:hypothetical protein
LDSTPPPATKRIKKKLTNKNYFVGFDVVTAMVMKITIFPDITPCSPLKVNRRFGGTYCLHLQGQIIQAKYQREKKTRLATYFHSGVLLVLIDIEDGGEIFLRKLG